MKPLFFTLVFFVGCTQAWATNPTCVQWGAQATCASAAMTHLGAGATTSTTPVFVNSVTAGNQVIAYVYCAAAATISITSNVLTDTFTTIVNNASDGASGEWFLAIAYSSNGGANDAVVFGFSASCGSDSYSSAGEWSNIASAGFDQGPASATGTCASGCTSGNVTLSNAVEAVLGVQFQGNGDANAVVGTGYTLVATTDTGSHNAAYEYKVVSACANPQAAGWGSFSSGNLQSSILTFKGSSAGASCTGGVKRLRGAVINR